MRFVLIPAVCLLFCGCRSPQESLRATSELASVRQSLPDIAVVSPAHAPAITSIEELVRLGLTHNPQIRASRLRIQALRQRIPQELSLPDPMVNTTTHLSPVETAAGRQSFAVGVSQKFVSVDRRATKAAMAQDEVRAQEANHERIRNELSERIRLAAFRLLAIRETIRITNEDILSLEQIEEVVLRQYEVKQDVTQRDVLNVQIERSKVENQLTELQQKEQLFSAQLARLIHQPPGIKFDFTETLDDIDHQCDVETMTIVALNSRPELRAQLARIQRDRHEICLANLQNRPDVTVGLNWIATSSSGISPVANGDDALLLGLGFNLPVRKNRIRAATCQAQHNAAASMAELESLKDQIAQEVFESAIQLDSSGSTLALLRDDIIPKAERTLELSIEEYANGKLQYTQLIDNWRAVLRYRIALVNLRSQRMRLLATLDRQIGQMHPSRPARAAKSLPEPSPLEAKSSPNELDATSSFFDEDTTESLEKTDDSRDFWSLREHIEASADDLEE